VDTDGATSGVFAGFETRVGGPWTFGLEGNWLAAGGDGSSPSGTGPGDTYNIEQNWTASVRGRVAYEVTPETQVYAEAGVAWADVDAQLVTGLQTDSATMTGWTVGVGLQHDYSEHVFVRAGYRYYDYDSEAFATALPSSADLSSHTAMIGVGWRFNT
jgi:outer membrane immunogenic protein